MITGAGLGKRGRRSRPRPGHQKSLSWAAKAKTLAATSNFMMTRAESLTSSVGTSGPQPTANLEGCGELALANGLTAVREFPRPPDLLGLRSAPSPCPPIAVPPLPAVHPRSAFPTWLTPLTVAQS